MNKTKFKVGDKVRILDGSKIHKYTGSWSSSMSRYVGQIYTIAKIISRFSQGIAYHLKEIDYTWDERGLELVKSETIVIYRNGNEVIALDKVTGKKGIAKCNPKDEFAFETGAKLAFERLFSDHNGLKIGDIVKVINTGEAYPTNAEWVCKHISDKSLLVHYAYDCDLGYHEGIYKRDELYKVLHVAEGKAYITENIPQNMPCYLININGLKRC